MVMSELEKLQKKIKELQNKNTKYRKALRLAVEFNEFMCYCDHPIECDPCKSTHKMKHIMESE